jgi:hypothetical protein
MAVLRLNIAFKKGRNFALVIQARNSDKTVMDLSGYTGKMQVRPTADSSTILAEASSTNGRLTINGPTGIISVLIPADVTEAMSWESGVYDLEVTNGATNIKDVAEGFASLSKEVTR